MEYWRRHEISDTGPCRGLPVLGGIFGWKIGRKLVEYSTGILRPFYRLEHEDVNFPWNIPSGKLRNIERNIAVLDDIH